MSNLKNGMAGWIVSFLLVVVFAASCWGDTPDAGEMAIAKQWADEELGAKCATQPNFSFIYGGKHSEELLPTWKIAQSTRDVDATRSEQTTTLSDTKTGLIVSRVAVVYHDFPAVESMLYFKNAGNADTPILGDIQPLDATIGIGRGPFTLHYAGGSHAKVTDFQPMEKVLAPGDSIQFSGFGGRSSDGALPFFNLTYSGGGSAIAIGWTGQWAASFTRLRVGGGGAQVRAGMETTHFILHPGEEVRSPAVLVTFWSGADHERGQNQLRQLLLRHYTPTPGGKPVEPPLAASCGAIPFEKISEANITQAIANIAVHKIPFDTWWIDAGWFTCPGSPPNWAAGVGNPDPDPLRFPRGLKPVADATHTAGMRFLLWIEPERVMRDTWLFQNHRDWLLEPSADMPAELQYQLHDGFYLLNLGNPDALAWVKQKISGMITADGIDCYRNDFNLYPLYFWRNGEAPDRQGINEIRYVTGLYDYFDTLQREHPSLLIDNCASGGRRIDFEMLRRAVVLTRSDFIWDPIGQQCHTFGLAQWIPITGIGSDSPDVYKCRSGLGSHFALSADYFSKDAAVWDAIARTVKECRQVKNLYTGDFYPLSKYSTAPSAWLAWQFHRADLGEGVVQAFRRQDCADDSATYHLCGLDPTADYAVTNLDDSTSRKISGKELMERGLTIQLPTKPTAALYVYRKLER